MVHASCDGLHESSRRAGIDRAAPFRTPHDAACSTDMCVVGPQARADSVQQRNVALEQPGGAWQAEDHVQTRFWDVDQFAEDAVQANMKSALSQRADKAPSGSTRSS